MKILLISSTPSNRGGISNWVRILSEYANNNSDCGVELLRIETRTYKDLKHGFFERFAANGIDIFRIRKELKKKCKIEKPDVIHITATGEWSTLRDIAALKIAQKYHIPTVYHTHFGRLPQFIKKNNLMWKMQRKAISLSTSIWTIDPLTKQAVESVFPQKDVQYVPNPVELDNMPMVPETSEKTVAFLGWLVKTKGVEELLEAWQSVKEKYPQYTLKLIGPYNAEYLESLKERYSFDNVVVTGRLEHDDAMKELANSTLFILPSYTEGFPNVIIEAMVLKRPIIGTDVGAIADILDGNCGKVIKPACTEDVINSLTELLGSPELCKEMGENAFVKASKNYASGQVFALYKKLWEQCITHKCNK